MPLTDARISQRCAEMAEELAGVGYWRMDAMTGTLAWSPNMFRIMGFKGGQQPSLNEAMQRVHPEDRQQTQARLKHNLAGKTAFSTMRVIWPSGEIRHLESRNACELDDEGRVIAVLGTSVDVTERVRLQESLAASEQYFRALADTCPDIITRCTPDGRFTYVSPAVATVLGYRPDEVLGKTAYDFMHPADVERLKATMTAYLAGPAAARTVQLDCRMIHKLGHPVWVESSPRAILDTATGAFVEMQDIVRDVTLKKRQMLKVA